VLGNRQTFLIGCLLNCAFTLACGLSRTGAQMIVFRGFSGIAASFCLPSAVSLINEAFPPGRARNIAFASMGGAQPLGFGMGLTLGGVLTDTIGWQWGFHIAAIANVVMLVIATWQLPKNVQSTASDMWHRLVSDVDWVGVILASSALALLSYALSYVNPDLNSRGFTAEKTK
jgi:MFS family permease